MDHIEIMTCRPPRSYSDGVLAESQRKTVRAEISRMKEQFEREMKTRYRTYMSGVNGMQLLSNELIGDSSTTQFQFQLT